MVFGVGIDIIEVERVEHRVASGNGFREMVFSPAEIYPNEAWENFPFHVTFEKHGYGCGYY